MAATLIPSTKAFHLTEQECIDRGDQPLYLGDFWSYRFQLLNEDGTDAIDLSIPTNATITFEIEGADGTVFLRSTGVALAGAYSLNQIVLDPAQGTGDENSDTGKGWFTIYIAPEDLENLCKVLGKNKYFVRVSIESKPSVFVRGFIDVIDP